MRLYDAHCHLQEPELAPMLAEAMRRAAAAGVVSLMCCGTAEGDWERVARLCAEYPGVAASYGLHPWYVAERSPNWLDRLTQVLDAGRSGVGEIGLDHGLEVYDAEAQALVFEQQLDLAEQFGRPVSVHCRKAFGALSDIVRRRGPLKHGGVVHSYSGAADLAPLFVEYGFHISFSGSIVNPHNRRGRASLAAVPDERLLIETDCPAINPAGAATAVNEPANLAIVLKAVAEVRRMPEERVAELTYTNAVRLFGGA
jgi:TatD DNase family protein